jgi:FkbM family methyltransferase
MYEEIFKLIEKGELDKAQEMIDKTPENDPKRYNISGLIYYLKKELEKAKEEFEKGLKIDAVDSDLLFNYGYLLKEMNQEKEAWRYLMRIHKKDWATYDMLGDIEFKTRSKLSALRFYKKAAELTDSPNEMKKKFLDMRNNIKQDTKIAFLCLPGLDNFLKDIVETFSLGYDVKLVVTTDGNQIAEAIKWADIVWLEWANDLAIFATNNVPEIQNKKVVCRLHGYEIFGGYPQKINWEMIDKLIFVGDHIKRILHELHPNLNIVPTKEVIIPNGVDLDRFKFSLRKPGYNLAILAHINYRKNPEFWIQIISKLKDVDNKYCLHVGGDFQDPLYLVYFNYIRKEMKIEDNFILHGWINNVEEFLEDKDYILSTSIHESFGYNIAEAMARGIKPIIQNYSGSKEQWPNELIYNTIDEAVEKITEQTYDSEGYRRFIEDNYSLEKQIDLIENLLNKIPTKKITNIYSFKYNSSNIYFFLPNPEDYIQRAIMFNKNYYELQMLEFIQNTTKKKNLVIVDAGANIGNHTIFFSKFLDAKRVYAFEPQKYVFEILSKNIKLNNLENKVKLYNIGLGEKRSKGSLIVVDENNLGRSKLNLNSEGEIEVIPLDDILFNKEDKVDLIKIDVEGMELDVLKGAKKILSEYHPDLYIEAITESQFLSISQYLSNYNYIAQKRFNRDPTFLFKSSL